MINNKERVQIYYTEGVNYLRSESEATILTVDNATYLSGGVADDATVSFAQSASTDGSGNQYIKITIGASTSTATTSTDECANYLFWDTGFRGYHAPGICLTMDCSGALESDLVTAANSGLPVVVYGWCWAAEGAAPMMYGKSGRDTSDVINTGLAWRMGNGANADVAADMEHGTSNFSFAGTNAGRGSAAGCRGFRNKVVANTMIFDTSGSPEVYYKYSSYLSNTPGTNCDGDNIQQNVKSTGDAIPFDHKLYVFLGAGNTATGGDACTFAGIFKMRIK